MATRYKVPGTTDLSSTSAWSATYLGAGGATVPVAGDTVIFGQDTAEITAGLDALNFATGVASVTFYPEYRGGVAEGASLTIACAGTIKISAQGARLSIIAGTVTCPKVVVSTGGGSRVTLAGGTITAIHALSGHTAVVGVTWTTMIVRSTANVYDGTGSSGTTATVTENAYFESERSIANVSIDGQCKYRPTRNAAISGTLTVAGSAEAILNNSGTINAIVQTGPTSMVSPRGSGTPVTVTTRTSYSGEFITESGSAVINVGSTTDVSGPGATSDPSGSYIPPSSQLGRG